MRRGRRRQPGDQGHRQRGFLIPTGIDISCAPTFSDIEIGGESRTAIRIAVYVHRLAAPSVASDAPELMAR